ncbi:hypothetical protein [Glutamicibacter sp. NPDC087583]|uniref:hypothetical protein n=1 Tax=Glutamicibacter sp. NPDC087583 TaxID=3363995 RepID=UPI0037F5CC53
MNDLSAEDTDALKALITRSNLDGVQFHEIYAKINDDIPDGIAREDADVELHYQTRTSDSDFGVRVTVNVTSDSGNARVVVAAEYSLESGGAPEPTLLDLFASEVAIMTLFPFVREGIQSATSRVFGVPLLLPVLERGQIRSNTSAKGTD